MKIAIIMCTYSARKGGSGSNVSRGLDPAHAHATCMLLGPGGLLEVMVGGHLHPEEDVGAGHLHREEVVGVFSTGHPQVEGHLTAPFVAFLYCRIIV